MIDFTPVRTQQINLAALAERVTLADLRAATHAQIDFMLGQIRDLSDDQVTVVATDSQAPDGVGWNVAHLLTHATATSEESAAVSSILARGIAYPFEPRLRVEADWRKLTSVSACVSRLEESRRMRLGHLDTWPDQPRLDTLWGVPERLTERFGPINAITAYLMGLLHEMNHFAQLEEIIAQARDHRRAVANKKT